MPVEVEELTVNIDKDSRGFEIQGLQKSDKFRNQDIADVVIQTICPHKRRGNHYHKDKIEWFFPLRGIANLGWSNIDDENREKHMLLMAADFQNPKIYMIRPNTCHWVENKTEEDFYMISFSNKKYDPNDKPPC